MPPALSTERLLLRPFRMTDVDDLFAYTHDSEVARTSSWDAHLTIDEARAFLERTLRGYERGERSIWAMEHLADGRMMGTIGLYEVTTQHARAVLAYALARPAWNSGYTTEAASRIITYGFENLSLNRIEGFCLPQNGASRRVMDKVGMTYEGTLRERMWLKGAFRDLAFYSILKAEWTEQMGRTVV